MSAEELFRELCEEMKSSTAEMLQNAKPSQVDISEDPCEFVELVSASAPEKPHNRDDVEPVVYNPPDMKTPAQLMDEIKRELARVNAMLREKKAICAKLDGPCYDVATPGFNIAKALEGDSDDSSDSDDDLRSADSESSGKVDPQAQREFEERKQKIAGSIKHVQKKVKEMKISINATNVDKNKNSTLVRSDSVSSVQSGTSSVKSGKNARFKKGTIKFHHSQNKQNDTKSTDKHMKTRTPGPSGSGLLLEASSSDNELLLTLLSLSVSQREVYLTNVGRERLLLVPATNGKGFEINPVFKSMASGLKSRALKYCYGKNAKQEPQEPVPRPSVAVQEIGNNQLTKKVRETHTFEEEVSLLLNSNSQQATSPDKKAFQEELTLRNVSEADVNGYLTQPNEAALANFVARLVTRGVGYLIEGVTRINGRNVTQAFVNDPTRDSDVFLNTILIRKCAMEGDLVKVFVKHGAAQNGPEQDEESDNGEKLSNNRGFVVEILEKRHSRRFMGSFMPHMQGDSQYIKMRPRDDRIPFVRIYRQHWPVALFQNDFKDIQSVIYHAEIIKWINDAPVGIILKSVGQCGELEVENESILLEYDLDISPYSEKIINGLPPSSFQIPQKELSERIDLRDECVFTIDPLTARDLDDALSIKLLKNGNYEIGVHISDVSYFLKEGSKLDELVKLRATSIYMVDNVYHMLPKPLCFLCSLLPGEDKLTFSVFWEITPDAEILQTRFAKTVINSCTQLAYEHAQIMLDKPNGNLDAADFPEIHHGYSPNYISRMVNLMQSIAVQLRARRMQNGCLKINQPKLTFTLDPNSGKPTAFAVYELKPANQMIEDFMLLANSSVAEFTYSKFADISILRSHLPPAPNPMKGLVSFLAKHGHQFQVHTSKAITESLEAIVSSSRHPDAALAAMNVLLAKPMTRANYFCSATASRSSDFHHFALAIPMYTHFTSPIRRYADCMVHRVLTAALGLSDRPARTPDELTKLADICNEKKYNAKLAGEASSLLYFKFYLKTVEKIDTEAAILDIMPHQVEVVLIATGHVIKATFKQLAKTVDIQIDRTRTPIRFFTMTSKDDTSRAAHIRVFSKVRVTVQLKNDTLNVTSMGPVN
ncbi:DIS3-like exonuclease 2 [Toxorhynchites rutilus septentrionalis]|uniref:DIS3-like exonuclease 2 n=1 Tax=Toxorhynchites rutilus septentrionalis TaxID=329112 RepID=UPI0024787A6C|nr:DIS3-like exonuclease 2 [Toxorhynchites rutilus septentrionalis]